MKKIERIFLFFLVMPILFSSCALHHAHITTDINFTGFCADCSLSLKKASDNEKTTDGLEREKGSQRIAFARYYSAFQRPRGIARFPDGGTVKRHFAYLSLYEMDHGSAVPRFLTDLDISAVSSYPVRVYLDLKGDLLLITTAFSGARSYIYDMRTKEKEPLGDMGYSPKLSPDSESIAYIKGDLLQIREIETGDESTVSESGEYFRVAAWSQDARYIYIWGKGYPKKDREKYRYDLVSDKVEVVEKIDGCTGTVEDSFKEKVEALPFDVWGKPTPLELNPASNKRYRKDLITYAGDKNYRRAIADRIIIQGETKAAEEILREMEEYHSKLEDLEKMKYEGYLENMKKYIAQHPSLAGNKQ